MPPSVRSLDADTQRAAQIFLRRIASGYPVARAIVYGSRARGDHRPDSDADLAVILSGQRGDRVAASLDMAGVAFDVMMETGVLVQGFPLWDEELRRPESFSNPSLIENILREGIPV